jgi:hypothetical protein
MSTILREKNITNSESQIIFLAFAVDDKNDYLPL